MNVQSINNDINTKQWMKTIKECRESWLPVKMWCKQNNVCEQTYYKWLKKLRTMAVEVGDVLVLAFVPVD